MDSVHRTVYNSINIFLRYITSLRAEDKMIQFNIARAGDLGNGHAERIF